MKKAFFAIFLAVSTGMMSVTHAKSISDCDASKADNIDYSRCLDRVKSAVDRELQTWINNQIFILEDIAAKTGRKSALNMFKRANSDFIKYRENNCRWQYLAISPATTAGSAYKECYIRLSRSRIADLSQLNTEK
ncbi:lysozyme inhibitor LprI family protein [Thalassotalea montiporae]